MPPIYMNGDAKACYVIDAGKTYCYHKAVFDD